LVFGLKNDCLIKTQTEKDDFVINKLGAGQQYTRTLKSHISHCFHTTLQVLNLPGD